MVDTIRQVERFGFFRMNESFEDLEVKQAMDAVWGVTPRARDLEEDIRQLPDIELVPRTRLQSQTEASQTDKGQETFLDKAVNMLKGKDTAESS